MRYDSYLLNPNIDINELELYIYENKFKIDWNTLSHNERINWDFIRKYIHQPWNFRVLSNRHRVNFSLIYEYPEKDWDWDGF